MRGITLSPKRRFEIPRSRRSAGESLFARTLRSTPACRESSQHGVTVTLTDWRQVTRLRQSARGDFQEPYREDEVRAKFRGLAGVVLSRGAVTRVEELVERLDELPRLSDLVVALTL